MWPRCSWAWYIPTGCGTAAFRRRRPCRRHSAQPPLRPAGHLRFVIALAVGLLVYYFLFYTSKGFQLRAVGLNMTAAEFNGFAVKKYILMSFIVSGAIAGLGGSAELLGTQFRLINGFGNGYGFDGVAMA